MKKYTISHDGSYSGDDNHSSWYLYENGIPLFCTSVTRQLSFEWINDTQTRITYPEGVIISEGYEVLEFIPTTEKIYLFTVGDNKLAVKCDNKNVADIVFMWLVDLYLMRSARQIKRDITALEKTPLFKDEISDGEGGSVLYTIETLEVKNAY